MKILHINGKLDAVGGVDSVFVLTIRGLTKYTAIENVLAYGGSSHPEWKSAIDLRRYQKEKGAHGVIEYLYSRHNYAGMKKYLEVEEFDLIHLHDFMHLSPSILRAIQHHRRGARVVYTVHNYHAMCPNASLFNFARNELCERCISKSVKYPVLTENCDSRGWGWSAAKFVKDVILNQFVDMRSIVDRYICPSEFIRAKLLDEGLPASKLQVIRNPVENIDEEIVHGDKKNVICYFGRFSPEKNVEVLIKAFDIVVHEHGRDDYQLLLIGGGECYENYVRMLEALSLSSQSTIINEHLERKALYDMIGLSRLFVLPSICYENSPMSVLEAIANDIVPVVTDIGGMKETVEYLECGRTFKNNEPRALADVLKDCMDDYRHQRGRVFNARQKAARELNVECYTQSLERLYGGLLK